MWCKSFYTVALLVFIPGRITAQTTAWKWDAQKEITVTNAAVVSAHPLASQAGLWVLRQGGNAIDAAIATQFALAVVYPGAGNLGGGGFLLAHLSNGKNISIDYREMAPGMARRDMYLDPQGSPRKLLSQKGHLACGVPGTVAGIFASMKYGRLPIHILLKPAIDLAEKGFVINSSQAADFNSNREDFIRYNTRRIVFVKDSLWKAGDTLIQPALARTLKRIRMAGAKGFYEGETARLLLAEMKRGYGIISATDLKNYKAKERKVLSFKYKGHEIIGMGLPSSGGILVQQMMKMIEHRNIASMGFLTANSIQLMVEAERRAFADRARWMGDADFVKVPVRQLLSSAYLQQRMNDFVPGRAGNSDSTAAGLVPESEETTHLSIIDAEGNAVSVTTTLNDSYGSKTMIAGGGFFMNDEMDDFSIKEGFPNMYGALGSAANAIAPRKRMLSSMTPTIVLKDNRPYIVVGTPGGTTIPTSIFQTLVNLLEFKLEPAAAVNEPKFHHQWKPDSIEVEKNFPEAVLEELTMMGYKIKKRSAIGRVELIRINYKPARIITAIADNRSYDDARGF